MSKQAIIVIVVGLLALGFVTCWAGTNGQTKAAIHIKDHMAKQGCSNLPPINSCYDIITTYEGLASNDIFFVFYDFSEYEGLEFSVTWPMSWGSGTFSNCADFVIGGIQVPGDIVSMTWLDCQSPAERVAIPGWTWLYPADAGRIEICESEYGPPKIFDCSEPQPEPDTLIYTAAGGINTPGDPPCGDYPVSRYELPEGLRAARGQIAFAVPITGLNGTNLKGFSVCVHFNPLVFSANPAVVATEGSIADAAFLVTPGSTDTTAQVGVVYSYSCPPSVPSGGHFENDPYIYVLLDVHEGAPLGLTTIEVADAGLSKNRMTSCTDSTIIPVRIGTTVEIVSESFIRGDDDGDGELTITDPIVSLCAQFADCRLTCLDASDVDDDGEVTISDPIYNLEAQFAGGALPPSPFPDCGPDLTADALGCSCHAECMSCAELLTASMAEVRIWLGESTSGRMGNISYPLYLESSIPLLAFECTVEFPPEALAFVGAKRLATGDRVHDFLAADKRDLLGGRLRIGDVVSLDLSRPLETGVHNVATLDFRQLENRNGEARIAEGRFVAVGPSSGIAVVEAASGLVDAGEQADRTFSLHVLPNPFSRGTRIKYRIGVAGPVTITIYNTSGQVVRKLVDGPEAEGEQYADWDGRNQNGAIVPPGIYFCRLSSDRLSSTAKMIMSP